jgi:hypothetical protein
VQQSCSDVERWLQENASVYEVGHEQYPAELCGVRNRFLDTLGRYKGNFGTRRMKSC